MQVRVLLFLAASIGFLGPTAAASANPGKTFRLISPDSAASRWSSINSSGPNLPSATNCSEVAGNRGKTLLAERIATNFASRVAKMRINWNQSARGAKKFLSEVHHGENLLFHTGIAMLVGAPLAITGQGGGGKTHIVSKLFEQQLEAVRSNPEEHTQFLNDARTFFLQLHENTSISEILGAPNPFSAVSKADYRRITVNSLADLRAYLAFFDDFHNAPIYVQMALLSALNERKIFDGNIAYQIFAKSIVLAMNASFAGLMAEASPHEVRSRMALLDRLVFKFDMINTWKNEHDLADYVEILEDNLAAQRKALKSGKKAGPPSQDILSVFDIATLVQKVTIPDHLASGAAVDIAIGMESYYMAKYNAAIKEAQARGRGESPSYYPPFMGSVRGHTWVLPTIKAAFLFDQLLKGVAFDKIRYEITAADLHHLGPALLEGGPDKLEMAQLLSDNPTPIAKELLVNRGGSIYRENEKSLQDFTASTEQLKALIKDSIENGGQPLAQAQLSRENLKKIEMVRRQTNKERRDFLQQLMSSRDPKHIQQAALYSMAFTYLDLLHQFPGKEKELQALLTGAGVSRTVLFLYGGPGSAKSMISDFLFHWMLKSLSEPQKLHLNSVLENTIKEAHLGNGIVYKEQFHIATPATNIVGRPDLAALQKGQGNQRVREGTLSAEDVFFSILDEFTNASPGVQKSAYAILNERKLFTGLDSISSDIISFVICSNMTPGEFMDGLDGTFSQAFATMDRLINTVFSANKLPVDVMRLIYARVNSGIRPSMGNINDHGSPDFEPEIPFIFWPLSEIAMKVDFNEGSEEMNRVMKRFLATLYARVTERLVRENRPLLEAHLDTPRAAPQSPQFVSDSLRRAGLNMAGTLDRPALFQAAILSARVFDALKAFEGQYGVKNKFGMAESHSDRNSSNNALIAAIEELTNPVLQKSETEIKYIIPIKISDLASFASIFVTSNPFYSFRFGTLSNGRPQIEVAMNSAFLDPLYVNRLTQHEKHDIEVFKQSHESVAEEINNHLKTLFETQLGMILEHPDLFPSLFTRFEDRIRWLKTKFTNNQILENYGHKATEVRTILKKIESEAS